MNPISGIRAVVTGGASGIGAAVVSHLQACGATAVALDRSPTDGLSVTADLTDSTQVAAAMDDAARLLGGIDVLINNAGIGAVGDVTEATEDEWFGLWNVNVVGIARATKAALPYLKDSSNASIVNTSSVVASVGVPKRAVYSATKAGVLGLTYAMAADLAGDGIRVNAVAPGTADTPWIARLLDGADDPAAARSALEARQPIGRLVTAREVAEAITYLASPATASTTGTVIYVDGGMRQLRLPR